MYQNALKPNTWDFPLCLLIRLNKVKKVNPGRRSCVLDWCTFLCSLTCTKQKQRWHLFIAAVIIWQYTRINYACNTLFSTSDSWIEVRLQSHPQINHSRVCLGPGRDHLLLRVSVRWSVTTVFTPAQMNCIKQTKFDWSNLISVGVKNALKSKELTHASHGILCHTLGYTLR